MTPTRRERSSFNSSRVSRHNASQPQIHIERLVLFIAGLQALLTATVASIPSWRSVLEAGVLRAN